MENKEHFDVIVLGAGVSGMAITGLLALKSKSVCLIERHHYFGGCASFYKNKGFTYDVGATTLTGLAPDRPLGKLLDRLDLNLEAVSCDPSQTIVMADKTITRFAGLKQWAMELEKHFPGHDHLSFWTQLERESQRLWNILPKSRFFPPRKWRDLKNLFIGLGPRDIDFVSMFTQSLYAKLPETYQNDPKLLELLNEQLLISTQSTSKEVPYAIAVLGLCYPGDQVYLMGGMKTLIDSLQSSLPKGAAWRNYEVISIEKLNQLWKVVLKNHRKQEKVIFSKNLVSTLPIWNMKNITSDDVQKYYQKLSERFPPKWSAFSAYGSIQLDQAVKTLYYQVHDKALSEWLGHSGSFFISLSCGEKARAPDNYRTVTVSTHVDIARFQELEKKYQYEEIKEKFLNLVLSSLKRIFPQAKYGEFVAGTPHTFSHFTGRYQGSVGGIPQSFKNHPIIYPKDKTPFKGLYQAGDTTFPGQGIVGVVQGAMNLVDSNFS